MRYVLTRAIPILGRLVFVTALIELARLHVLAASVVGIGAVGVLGFISADRLVFRAPKQR
jgi:putative flippase GtrA